eukprot:jgi/Hompol1/62/HPOL_003978-RA
MFAVEKFPLWRILFSLGCHAWYSQMLPSFPAIQATSIVFIVSCILVLADHFVWFFYFAKFRYSMTEIASFFGILVWMVPFMYFISLSANDYTLPAFGKMQMQMQIERQMENDELLADDFQQQQKPQSPKKKTGNLIKMIANFVSAKKEELIPSTSSSKYL